MWEGGVKLPVAERQWVEEADRGLGGMAPWEDGSFPADDSSLGPLKKREGGVVWLRNSEVAGFAGGGESTDAGDPLFGGVTPSASDVIGDSHLPCHFGHLCHFPLILAALLIISCV